MRITTASPKAIKYACENFHYSKKKPAITIKSYNIYNDNNEWCGVILYNYPNGKHIANKMSECLELIRVALNGKQEQTSKAIALTIKDIKKNDKSIKLLISYADTDQNHNGTIYQATNWYYVDKRKTSDMYKDKNGKIYHTRVLSNTGVKKNFNKYIKVLKPKDLIKIEKGYKHLYYYPLDKSLIPICEKMKKNYPKKEVI